MTDYMVFIRLPTLDPAWKPVQGGAHRDLLEAVGTESILAGQDERSVQAVHQLGGSPVAGEFASLDCARR